MSAPTISQLLEEHRSSGTLDLERLADAIPYMKFLGMDCLLKEGELLARLKYSEHLIGNSAIPALHGGTIGALLESAAILESLRQTRAARVPKVVTITFDYLRSGRSLDTFARAKITRLGRRVVNVAAVAWQDDADKPIATANAILLLRAE